MSHAPGYYQTHITPISMSDNTVGRTMSRKALFEVSYVDRLLRERDEARAELQAISAMEDMHIGMLHEAEQRGYRKGVEDAAKVALNHTERYDGLVAYTIRKAILALLEKEKAGDL